MLHQFFFNTLLKTHLCEQMCLSHDKFAIAISFSCFFSWILPMCCFINFKLNLNKILSCVASSLHLTSMRKVSVKWEDQPPKHPVLHFLSQKSVSLVPQ